MPANMGRSSDNHALRRFFVLFLGLDGATLQSTFATPDDRLTGYPHERTWGRPTGRALVEIGKLKLKMGRRRAAALNLSTAQFVTTLWYLFRRGKSQRSNDGMNSLISNEFAPVTFRFGFVETSFPSLCDAFKDWHRTIDAKFGVKTEFGAVDAPLETALQSLEPLTTPLDRYLLVETRSNWSAIFANGLRVNDVCSPVSYLPLVLNCRGLEVGYAPDQSKSDRKDLIRKWGHTLFALYGPSNTDWLNRIRYLSVSNDVSGWSFSESGEVQPFEEPGRYKEKRVRERFTVEMLERYCRALGIELNQVNFYGPRGCAVRTTGQNRRGDLTMSIAEARSHL